MTTDIRGTREPETDTKIQLVRVFHADRRRVFRAFTDPAQLRVWFCPDGFHFTDIRVDPASGRATDFVMEDGASGHQYAFTLEYELVDEPNRIRWFSIWRDGFPDAGRRTKATIVFRDVPGGTEVTLTHENFPDARTGAEHRKGWSGGFDKLAHLLAR
jgi:uncharacterized protein YndB with AHSA1/START domain